MEVARYMLNFEDLLPADAPIIHQKLVDHWSSIRAERMPTGRDFSFETWASQEHEAYQIKAQRTGEDQFEFWFGEASSITGIGSGADISNQRLKDVLEPKVYEQALEAYALCLKSGEPDYYEMIRSQYGRAPAHFFRLALPLHSDTGETDLLFCSIFWLRLPS